MQPEEIRRLILDGIPDADVRVSGDGRHFEALVISDQFVNKNTLQQHRIVYSALGDRFDSEAVHALSIKTYSKKAWENVQKQSS